MLMFVHGARFTLKLSKCDFIIHNNNYMWGIIPPGWLQIFTDNQHHTLLHPPTSVLSLRSCLGLCSVFCKLVSLFVEQWTVLWLRYTFLYLLIYILVYTSFDWLVNPNSFETVLYCSVWIVHGVQYCSQNSLITLIISVIVVPQDLTWVIIGTTTDNQQMSLR